MSPMRELQIVKLASFLYPLLCLWIFLLAHTHTQHKSVLYVSINSADDYFSLCLGLFMQTSSFTLPPTSAETELMSMILPANHLSRLVLPPLVCQLNCRLLLLLLLPKLAALQNKSSPTLLVSRLQSLVITHQQLFSTSFFLRKNKANKN